MLTLHSEATDATEFRDPCLHLLLGLGYQVVGPVPCLYIKYILILLMGEVRVHCLAILQVYDSL